MRMKRQKKTVAGSQDPKVSGWVWSLIVFVFSLVLLPLGLSPGSRVHLGCRRISVASPLALGLGPDRLVVGALLDLGLCLSLAGLLLGKGAGVLCRAGVPQVVRRERLVQGDGLEFDGLLGRTTHHEEMENSAIKRG